MFDNDELVELDAAGTLAAAEANEHILITAETRRLQLAAHWADLHPGDAVAESRLPGREHPVRLGGEGTPTVADFAPAELGCVLRISDGSACRLIGDALDLRHRLSKIWTAALAGQLPAYQARRIAAATRHLTVEQAAYVDAQLAPSLGALPWGRLQTLLEATIMEADPVGAEQQAAAAAQERFVRLGRNSEHGLKLIIARATAGDAIWFKATIDRIADILAQQGDQDAVDIRRSKAIGILAQPAYALQLLCQHQHDHWDGPTEPADDAEAPTGDQEEGSFNETVGDAEPANIPDQDAEPDASRQDAELADLRQPSCDLAPSEGTHWALQILPPPFHPDRARPPRRGLYPPQRRSRSRRHRGSPRRTGRPGAAQPATAPARRPLHHQPETGNRPTHRPHPSRQLRNTRPTPRTTATPQPRRHLPLRRRRQPADRPGSHHSLPQPHPDKPESATSDPTPATTTESKPSAWQVRQPEPGTWLWRSPHHRIYLVNATGTHPLGNTPYAQTIWHAASPHVLAS